MLFLLVELTSFLFVVISTNSWRTFLLVVSSVVLVLSFLLFVELSITKSMFSDVCCTGFRVTGAGDEGLSARLHET